MKDEIKEINIPENVLVALGDLTNGALNYYKATETVKVRHNTILDYITNLQKEYEIELDENYKLSEWLVQKQKRIEELEKENERLKGNWSKLQSWLEQEIEWNNNSLQNEIGTGYEELDILGFNRSAYIKVWENVLNKMNKLNGGDK